MGKLRKIPNIGKQTEKDLIAMGYATVASFYLWEFANRGCRI